MNEHFFDMIKMSLWGNTTSEVNQEIFEEMKQQAIAALPASCLSSLLISQELLQEWKTLIIQQLQYYTHYCYEQSSLPITVPYVILKGSSAAQYYPHPEYRMMGDIDIMTRREDLDTACKELMGNGYSVISEQNKEICLDKNGITIELHRRFASLNDPVKAKLLDDLIIDNINPSHILPDMVNGLVIIEHISQHMEGGLGLRQIIDWMMFVDKCLSDDKWNEFLMMAEKIGLEKLVIITTRICELYLGLSDHVWSAKADLSVCEQLMEYVMQSGNFGNKKTSDADISKNAFTYASTIRTAYKLLQKQGSTNWQLARKYKCLQSFAWIYQMFRYIHKGLHREKALSKLKEEYSVGTKRRKLFDELGVRTTAKGNIIIQDGKYIKE